MNPDRWVQIEELFHRAVESDPERRTTLLDEACDGDAELRQAVEALLGSEESAREDMRAAVRSGLDAVTFPLLGETVSHYRILDGLGGGGMGLVYRAEDLKLGRQVALKFLPEESAKDPAALARFEREARSASALEHPNICPIYEFGEHEGQPFLAMQLLKGQTLRELISTPDRGRAPLPVDKLLDLAIQIANGLEAAHSHGIIHRDIKPANIFVTTRGQAIILDFGLAKLFHSEAIEDEGERTPHEFVTRKRQASWKVIRAARDPLFSLTSAAIGTAGYMSPEQLRGERLDARTDLFSFGAVLYEMATGQMAFFGNTEVMVKEAIREGTPTPLTGVNPDMPSELERIVNKVLEKERKRRYQSATEIRIDLQRLKNDADLDREANTTQIAENPHYIETLARRGYRFIGRAEASADRSHKEKEEKGTQHPNLLAHRSMIESFGPGAPRTGVVTIWRRWRILAASILFLIVCALILWPLRRSGADFRAGSTEPQPVDTKRYLREPKYSNLWLVDLTRLGMLPSAQVEQPLTWGSSSYSDPSISPDGRWVAFSSKGNIFKMFIDGGEPIQLTSFGAVKSTSPGWSPNGEKIAFICDQGGTAKVWIINADGGNARSLSKTNASGTDLQLAWSPSPDVLYQQPGLHNVRRLNVDTQIERPVLSADSRGVLFSKPIPSPNGQKIAIGWERDSMSGLLIITLDNNLDEPSFRGFTPLGWSPDATSIYAYQTGGSEIVKLGLKDAKSPESVISVPGFLSFFTVAISPNGKRIVAAVDQDQAGDFGSSRQIY